MWVGVTVSSADGPLWDYSSDISTLDNTFQTLGMFFLMSPILSDIIEDMHLR